MQLTSTSGCTTPRVVSLSLARCRQRRSLQLFDLCELARCHLLHQIEHGLLFDFANLNELHGGNSNYRVKGEHPL